MLMIDEIMNDMSAIMDGANGRDLTDEEVERYTALEGDLKTAQRSQTLRDRHAAYNVVRTPAGVPAPPRTATDDRSDLDRAFENYLRTGQPNQDISGLRVMNAQSEGGSAAGGYLVPQGFRQKLVEVRKAFGGFAAEAETLDTDTGAPIEYPTIDDTANSGVIADEGTAPTTGADLVFSSVSLGAHKYTSVGASGLPLRVSVELLQDSAFDIEGLVSRKLGQRIARAQAPHFVTGTGVKQPQGIVNSALTADRDLDTADTPDYDDLVVFQDLLDDEYDANAKWLMRKSTWTLLRRIVDSTGRPLVQSAIEGIAGRPERILLGKPVVLDEAMPVLSAAADTFAIAYGDWREAYVVRRVSQLVVVVNPYARANEGEVEFSAWERADGAIQNRTAYKIMQNNT